MSGQKSHPRITHLSHGSACGGRVVDWPPVLVNKRQRAAPKGRALIEDRRNLPQVGPHRAEEWVVVHRPADVGSGLVQLEVEWDAERDGPVSFDDASVQVDAYYLRRPEFGPCEQPRVAQQGAVSHIDGDMPGQMVVVALPPQRAGEHD